MCGTGLVTIPWAYQQSGIVLGIFLTFVAFAFSFYTCFLVLKTAGNDIDYTDTLWKQFGKKGWTFGMISFIIMFTVPVVLLFQLLSQNLFPIILAAIEVFTGGNRDLDLSPDWSEFSYSWTCVIIFVIVYVMGIPPLMSGVNWSCAACRRRNRSDVDAAACIAQAATAILTVPMMGLSVSSIFRRLLDSQHPILRAASARRCEPALLASFEVYFFLIFRESMSPNIISHHPEDDWIWL